MGAAPAGADVLDRRATCDAVVRGALVRCSRCGSTMEAEVGWAKGSESDEDVPTLLWWRCGTGHVTAVLPLPPRLAFPLRLETPRL